MLPLNYILSHHLHMAGYTLKFLLPLLLYVFSFSPMLLYYIIGSRERKSTRIYYNFLSNTEISFDGWQTTKNLVRTCYIVMVVCVENNWNIFLLAAATVGYRYWYWYCGDFYRQHRPRVKINNALESKVKPFIKTREQQQFSVITSNV